MNVSSKRLKTNKFGCWITVIGIMECIFFVLNMSWNEVVCWRRQRREGCVLEVQRDVMLMASQKLIK